MSRFIAPLLPGRYGELQLPGRKILPVLSKHHVSHPIHQTRTMWWKRSVALRKVREELHIITRPGSLIALQGSILAFVRLDAEPIRN